MDIIDGIYKLLFWPHCVHAIGKLLCLLVIWQLTFHPDHVSVRTICDGPVDGTTTPSLVAVIALPRPWRIPVPVNVDASQSFCNGSRLRIAFALDRGSVLLDQARFVDVNSSIDHLFDSFIVEFHARPSHPLILDRLQRISTVAGLLSRDHEVIEWLQSRIRHSQNEPVISMIDR